MPLIDRHQIPELVALLEERDALLSHGCQLRDFKSYLAIGGVPSRAALENAGLSFTAFQTDDADHTNEVWDKTFFNLSDFGHWFAAGGAGSLPNFYGPILLVFGPTVLSSATDVCLSLRSAGGDGFDRVAESLTLTEIQKIFVQEGESSRHIKFKEALKADFPDRIVEGNPEMNCLCPNGIAPMIDLRYVIVDHYTQGSVRLDDAVKRLLRENGFERKVFRRRGKAERLNAYQALWHAISCGVNTYPELLEMAKGDQTLTEWATAARKWDTESFQFRRVCSYLRAGTINEPFQ